jgi:hypothetical protein
MPFYPFNETLPSSQTLREGLDDLRSARYKLAHISGVLSQMTDAQVASEFGFSDSTVAGNAKAELLADIGKLLNRDTGVNAAQLDDALIQLLNQFG